MNATQNIRVLTSSAGFNDASNMTTLLAAIRSMPKLLAFVEIRNSLEVKPFVREKNAGNISINGSLVVSTWFERCLLG